MSDATVEVKGEADLEAIQQAFNDSLKKPYYPGSTSGGIEVQSRYEKPFRKEEGVVQLYTDPHLARRYRPEAIASWANKLGEYVFSSGKPIYIYLTSTGSYQAHSLAGLVWVMIREKFRPFFSRFRRSKPPRSSWMTDRQYKDFCRTGRC